MLKHWTLLVLALTLCTGVRLRADDQQQQQPEMVTVTVPKSSLTVQQQENLKQQEIHSWVGVGKEVGEAVNSSLQAITTQSNNFAQTGIGKLTVAVVIWKVLGEEAVHISCGFIFALVGLVIWLWSYRKFLPKRVLQSETIQPDKTKVRTYGTVNNDSGAEGWRIAHWVAMVVITIIFATITFSY